MGQEELTMLRQEIKIKDDRINDLEESNKTIRQTLVLKDNKIHSLQDEVHELTMKMATHQNRAKSITMRPSRMKRASSFSIGKGGKITRTAMLPSQLDHNNKLIKAMNGSNKIQHVSNLHSPNQALQRSHAENK